MKSIQYTAIAINPNRMKRTKNTPQLAKNAPASTA